MYVKGKRLNKGVTSVKDRWVSGEGNTPDSQIVSFEDDEHYVEKEEFLSGDQEIDEDSVRYTSDSVSNEDPKENILGVILSTCAWVFVAYALLSGMFSDLVHRFFSLR